MTKSDATKTVDELEESSNEVEELLPISSRRQALIILEVLAGTRSSTEAAELLGVSANRYYQLEERAIEGMVKGLEPRPRGPARNWAKEVERLEREKRQLHEECARYQALVRASRLSVGIETEDPTREARRGRNRRPTVRALRAVRRLESESDPTESE